MIAVRRDDLLDAVPDDWLQQRIDASNRPLETEIRAITRALHGTMNARSVAAVTRAIVFLPYSVTRHYAGAHRLPGWLADDVAADARWLLQARR
ncbi:MAG: hypothetical protein M3Y73_13960 [Actinomycetota bacterium]|nr:hypothetical protein [Actinomycetota bacterium]